MMRLFPALLLSVFLISVAGPAIADPISGIIIGFKMLTATALGSFLVSTALSFGLSLLAQKFGRKQKEPGVEISGTTAGEEPAQRTIVGRYATGGHLAYHNSHGTGKTPNEFYTLVIAVSALPGVALRQLIVNDKRTSLGEPSLFTSHLGQPMLRFRQGGQDNGWIRFYDGTQTEADSHLVNVYGDDPDQPYTVDHIGTGVAYAVITLRLNREVWQGVPNFRFVLDGIPVYDPRKDDTVGGSGLHRWGQPATYEPSENPIVNAYNIMRGIPTPDGDVYGGEDIEAGDLPLSNWIAGMNVCDTDMGNRKRFTAGLEFSFDTEPAVVVEELLKACLGQISETGGVFRVRVAEPDEPVFSITDGDISISDPQQFNPFPGLEATHNALRINHPNSAALWEPVQTPVVRNAEWEAADGGRMLSRQLAVAACFSHGQAQALAAAYIADDRRHRVHQIVLPADAQQLEALDSIEWTSARNGYINKLFEVVEATYLPGRLFVVLTIRERDPDDYDWSSESELPPPPDLDPTPIDARVIDTAEWNVAPASIRDSADEPRRPALSVTWTPDVVRDARAIRYQIEVAATGERAAQGRATAADGEIVVSEGLLPDTLYQARVRPALDRKTGWTGWKTAITPDVRLQRGDLDQEINDDLDEIINAREEIDAIGDYIDSIEIDIVTAEEIVTTVEVLRDQNQAFTAAGEAAKAASELARDQAQTAASEADGSASAASGHAQTAETHADDASQSATAAQGFSVSAETTARALFPSDFSRDGHFFRSVVSGAPSSGPGNVSNRWSFHDVAGVGRAARLADLQTVSFDYLMPEEVIRPVEGRTYRLTVTARLVGAASGSPSMSLWFRSLSSNYDHTGIVAGTNVNLTEQWQTIQLDCPAPVGVPFMRPGFYRHQNVRGSGYIEVSAMVVEDVTSEVASEDHASAASDFSQAASVHADDAGTSAAAALGWRNQAQTARGEAQTFRNEAATSATNAAGSASTASTQAGISTNAANTAGGHASSAATSASNAFSSADDAETAAGAAQQDRLAAQTANTQAGIARNEAVSARQGAEGAAASAATSMGVAASISRDLLPSHFRQGADYWVSIWSHASPETPGSGFQYNFITSSGLNVARRTYSEGIAGLLTRGVITPQPGRTYRIRARIRRVHASLPAGYTVYLQFRSYDANYGYIGAELFTGRPLINSNADFHIYEADYTVPANPTYAMLRGGIDLRDGDPSPANVDIASIEILDVTGDNLAVDAQATADSAYTTAVDTEASLASIANTVVAQFGSLSSWAANTMTAIATAETVAARQVLSVTAGGNTASLELVAYNGTQGSGSAVTLNGDRVIIPGTLSARSVVVTDGSGNMVPSKYWESGHEAGFGDEISSGNLDWQLRFSATIGSAAATAAPTTYIFQSPPTTGFSRTSLASFPVRPGEVYSVSHRYAASGGPGDAITFGPSPRFFDRQGNLVGHSSAAFVTTAGTEAWNTFTADVTVPANAARCIVELRRENTNATSRWGYVTDVQVVRRRTGATLILPNSITTDLINVEQLVASNAFVQNLQVTNANISGALQSTNFSWGTAGWALYQGGNAQFNNLIVRGSLTVGSVSDIELWSSAEAVNHVDSSWTTAGTVTLGAMSSASTDIWNINWNTDFRAVSVNVGTDNVIRTPRFRIQKRVQTGGSWGNWENVADYETGNQNWVSNSGSDICLGNFQNVQYRYQWSTGSTGQIANFGTTNFRNRTLLARRIAR